MKRWTRLILLSPLSKNTSADAQQDLYSLVLNQQTERGELVYRSIFRHGDPGLKQTVSELAWARTTPQSNTKRKDTTPDGKDPLEAVSSQLWFSVSDEILVSLWAERSHSDKIRGIVGFNCALRETQGSSSSNSTASHHSLSATCVSTDGKMQTSGAQMRSSCELWLSSQPVRALFLFLLPLPSLELSSS